VHGEALQSEPLPDVVRVVLRRHDRHGDEVRPLLQVVDLAQQREEVLPTGARPAAPAGSASGRGGGETLCCCVPGALLPPRRERDPFLRFALDAEGELCPGRRREVEVATRLPHRRRQDVARVDTEAVDQVLPDRLLQPPPLALREAGVEATTQTAPCSLMSL